LTDGRYKYEPVDYYAEKVRFLGTLKSQIIVDTLTDTPVTFADVGVGLSQILPILQALYIKERGPLRESPEILTIEQPELHLHPAMQGDLADLFIDAINSRPNLQVIAETHSEALLLRVRKAIRTGAISPDKVQILYVGKASSVSESDESEMATNVISSLDMDPDDDFSVNFPLSFTRLRLDDLA
jgi:predicted ATPase